MTNVGLRGLSRYVRMISGINQLHDPHQTLRRGLPYILVPVAAYNMAFSLPLVGQVRDDFATFVAAGLAASYGQNPYHVEPMTIGSIYVDSTHPNLNPPVVIPLFEVVSAADPVTTFVAWCLFSLVLFGIVMVILRNEYPERFDLLRFTWTISLGGLWATVREGQIYMPLLLATIITWHLIPREHRPSAGLLIGLLVAVKPNFIVWPFLLLLAGYWPVALSALVPAALLSVVPMFFYSLGVYLDWPEASSAFAWYQLPLNASILGFVARLDLRWLGPFMAGALLLAIAAWIWHRRPHIIYVSKLALVLSLLVSPLAWPAYTLFLMPTFFERRWGHLLGAGAFSLVVPPNLLWEWSFLPQWHLLGLGSIYRGAVLLVLVALLRDQSDSRAFTLPHAHAESSARPTP